MQGHAKNIVLMIAHANLILSYTKIAKVARNERKRNLIFIPN